MHSKSAVILGAPLACWGLFGCLTLLGQSADAAGLGALVWGVVWLAVAHIGRKPRALSRDRKYARRRGARSVWNGAVLTSVFLPLPVYLAALLLEYMGLAQVSVTVPLFAVLCVPAPLALWWMAIWPAVAPVEETLAPLGWREYRPQVPAGIIPPRNSSMRRAS